MFGCVPQLFRGLDMWPRTPGAHAGDCKVASGLDMVRAQAFVSRDRRSSGLQLARSASLLARATLHCEENVLPFHPPSTWGISVLLGCGKLCRVLLCIRPRVSGTGQGRPPMPQFQPLLLMGRESCFQPSGSTLCRASFPHAWLPDLLMTSSDVRPTLKRHLLIFSKDDFPEGF